MHFIFSFLLFYFTIGTCKKQLCNDNERSALLHFKESLILDNCSSSFSASFAYPKVASWDGHVDCCSWDGVTCNEETGHVIKLDLSRSCLFGSIDSGNSLFRLVYLEWLNLAYNNFTNSKIPFAIMNCPRLSYLNLSSSYFNGQIASQILELSNLVSLDLSHNPGLKLENPDLENLALKLTKLKTLDLKWVEIASSIPHTLANMSSLTFLSLSSCSLQGKSFYF